MNVPTIPDYISPIVGYRVWNWHPNELRSLNSEAWSPGRALTAKCPKADHEPPADGCSCGVYAAKSFQHLQRITRSVEYRLHGEVYLWGKIVEHDLGYRAQFAYPKSLTLPLIDTRFEMSRLQSLIAYGAHIYTPLNVLLCTKDGYTQAGFDWMAERRKPWCERCKKWHGRILRMLDLGDSVMLLGRGIGLVERNDGSSGGNSDSVYVRLGNNDLYLIPFDDMVWDCGNSRWEVDLSRCRDAVILPSSKGSWKILCRPLEQGRCKEMGKVWHNGEYWSAIDDCLISRWGKEPELPKTPPTTPLSTALLQREQIEGTEEELMFRSLPRGEDR